MSKTTYTHRIHIVCSPKALDTVQLSLLAMTNLHWSFVDPHDDGENPNGYYQCSAQVTKERFYELEEALLAARDLVGEVKWSRGDCPWDDPTDKPEVPRVEHRDTVSLFLQEYPLKQPNPETKEQKP